MQNPTTVTSIMSSGISGDDPIKSMQSISHSQATLNVGVSSGSGSVPHLSNPSLIPLGISSFSSHASPMSSHDFSSSVLNGNSMPSANSTIVALPTQTQVSVIPFPIQQLQQQQPASPPPTLPPAPSLPLLPPPPQPPPPQPQSQPLPPPPPPPPPQQQQQQQPQQQHPPIIPISGTRNFFTGCYDKESVYQWILELTHPDTRERALYELCKKREDVPDLAPMLWHSFGTIAALLQEIIMIYPLINPPTLTNQQSNRVCNALALLQCVASHAETRTPFLDAQIPMFLYPFLNTSSRTRPYEYLRLTSLGVVGALVKIDEQEVIQFLLSTEIIPLCLRIMENGSDLSKTVATFILQKILQDATGLTYICHTCERFLHVSHTLSQMIKSMAKEVNSTNSRLLKHVIRCYLRLADDPRAREALKQHLPDHLKDNTFSIVLKDDQSTQSCLGQLIQTVQQTNLASLDTAVPSLMMST